MTTDKPGTVYALREPIRWRVELKDAPTSTPDSLHYTLKKGGYTVVREGRLALTNNVAVLEAALDEPNTLLAEFDAELPAKKLRKLAGAAVAPERIARSMPRPADFDAFWNAQVASLKAVSMNPVLEPAESGQPSVEYFKLRMDNIRGSHIYGQLARPQREGRFPALLIVQWAGVYGLPKANVVSQAEKGWLTLNIMAHDLPFDQPEAFYKQASETTLKDYPAIGNTNRDQSYFLRMYLSCYRAADYLAQRPDWDGKTLAVTGTSQGGLQALMLAGFHPGITALMAHVPAGCDRTGPVMGRAAGWPGWYGNGERGDQIAEVSRYYDVINFASRVKCPALVSVGMIDVTCPPSGVFAVCNELQGPKEVLVLPTSGHQDEHGSQASYYARSEVWNKALREGKPVPPHGP